jgi:hypothetical protein
MEPCKFCEALNRVLFLQPFAEGPQGHRLDQAVEANIWGRSRGSVREGSPERPAPSAHLERVQQPDCNQLFNWLPWDTVCHTRLYRYDRGSIHNRRQLQETENDKIVCAFLASVAFQLKANYSGIIGQCFQFI